MKSFKTLCLTAVALIVTSSMIAGFIILYNYLPVTSYNKGKENSLNKYLVISNSYAEIISDNHLNQQLTGTPIDRKVIINFAGKPGLKIVKEVIGQAR